MRAGLMSRMLDAVLPEGSAVRDFVEVGGLLASGVSIALVCSSIGGVVMDTLDEACSKTGGAAASATFFRSTREFSSACASLAWNAFRFAI